MMDDHDPEEPYRPPGTREDPREPEPPLPKGLSDKDLSKLLVLAGIGLAILTVSVFWLSFYLWRELQVGETWAAFPYVITSIIIVALLAIAASSAFYTGMETWTEKQ